MAFKKKKVGGTWLAQSVEPGTLGLGACHSWSWGRGFKSHIGARAYLKQRKKETEKRVKDCS